MSAAANKAIIAAIYEAMADGDGQPFLDAMAKGTGFKVNAFYASDYAGVIEGMFAGNVDVAFDNIGAAMSLTPRL